MASLATEDREAFERAKVGLEEMETGPRSAIDSDGEQNCLARYYLEEYGGLFLQPSTSAK